MRMVLAIGLLAGVFVWMQRNSSHVGEWLRRLTDGPINLVLIGTSGFEREGRDPQKRP